MARTPKKFEGLTREEKKQIVLREGGKETEYLSCPMCGFNRPLNKYSDGRVKFTNIDLDEFFVLTTRVGGGRASGFFRIDEKSFLLKEVNEISRHSEVIEQIREQAKKILAVLG